MNEITEILDSIKSIRTLKKIHIETIVETYLSDEEIDPSDVFKELKRFSKRISEPYSIIKKRFENEIEKQMIINPSIKNPTEEEDLYTVEDMDKPWNILQDMGYMLFQDKNSQKKSYFLKSMKRIGDKKDITIKRDDNAMIDILNSLAYQKNIKWNKPKKVNGQIVGFEPTIVDFRDANMTRYAHLELVFDPTTNDNITYFQDRECINVYSAPLTLSYKKKNDYNNTLPLHIGDFFRLLNNLVDGDSEAQIYLINWLAKNYQTKEVAQNFIWFCGESGTGKGLLVDILTNIYGEEFIGKGTPKNNIFKNNENAELKDKLYYHADEIKFKNSDDWEDTKAFIANKQFTLKALYENVRKYPNYAAFIFNSNIRKGTVPFSIPESKDRRTTAFESYTRLIDTKWATTEVREKLSYDKEFAKQVAQFLADWNVDFKLLELPYNNDLRRRMLLAGKPSIEMFADILIHRDIDALISMGLDSLDWITAEGKKALSYTWTQHIIETFEKGYIRTSTSKQLFKLLYEDEKEYSKEALLNYGLINKIKRIDVKGEMKPTDVFILPKIDKIKAIEEKIINNDEEEETENEFDKPKENNKPKINLINNKRKFTSVKLSDGVK